MQQFHKIASKLLFACIGIAFLLTLGLGVGDAFARYPSVQTADHILSPQAIWALPQDQPETKDYLQPQGRTVWLAPWSLPAYGEGEVSDKIITFSLTLPRATTVSVTGTESINATASLIGRQVTLTLHVTDAGKRLLTQQKNEIRLSCGNTYADFCLWLLPVGMSIPKDADNVAVELNQICRGKTENVYLKNGHGVLTLGDTDRNAYQLTFLQNETPVQGLRYSLDQGDTYIQLHDWNQIYLPLQASQNTTILLDYSQCDITTQSSLRVEIQRQNDNTQRKQTVIFGVEEQPPQMNLRGGPQLITPTNSLRLSTGWNGCSYTYQLYRLTKTEDNELVKKEISLPNGLVAVNSEENLLLSIAIDGELPEAGSYCLRIKWELEGVLCEQAEIPFFINYPFV